MIDRWLTCCCLAGGAYYISPHQDILPLFLMHLRWHCLKGCCCHCCHFWTQIFDSYSTKILKRPLHHSKTREYYIKWLSSCLTIAWHDWHMIMSCHAGRAYYWQQLGLLGTLMNLLSPCLHSTLFSCLVDIQTWTFMSVFCILKIFTP